VNQSEWWTGTYFNWQSQQVQTEWEKHETCWPLKVIKDIIKIVQVPTVAKS